MVGGSPGLAGASVITSAELSERANPRGAKPCPHWVYSRERKSRVRVVQVRWKSPHFRPTAMTPARPCAVAHFSPPKPRHPDAETGARHPAGVHGAA